MVKRLTKELEERVFTRVKQTMEKLNTHFKMNMPLPSIHYDIVGTKAGVARYATMSIHLNTKLLLENEEEMIFDTVPHEVCHLAAYYKHFHVDKNPGVPKAHGAAWKLMMWVAGVPARRTHDMDVEETKTRRTEYLYQCGCEQGLVVGKTIHNRMQEGTRYRCKRCHQTLHNGQRIIKNGFATPSPNGTTAVREED